MKLVMGVAGYIGQMQRLYNWQRKTKERQYSQQSHRCMQTRQTIFLNIAAVLEAKEESEYMEPTKKLFWRIMVNDLTQYKLSDFFVSKRAMI
jgi:hypothetical protein